MNIESVSALSRLGLMDPLEAIKSIIDHMQPAELMSIRSKVNSIVEDQIAAVKRKAKRTRLKELEAWHLKCGDREIVAKCVGDRNWRAYECERTKSGEIRKGRVIRAGADSLDSIAWDMATGQY
jgi:hypothetical protein